MRISVKHIQESVAADFGIPASMMTQRSKRREHTLPRLIAFKLSRELTPLSFTTLGRLFQRDHTTLVTGIRAADRYLSNDRNLALKVEARKLLLQSEPQKLVDATSLANLGFFSNGKGNDTQSIHSRATYVPLGDRASVAA